MSKLKLIVLGSAKELGSKVNKELKKINKTETDYLVKITESRFSNGEGKVQINENVSNCDVYIIGDVGNYGVSYPMHGREHFMSPDEHYEDIKRVISATSGHAAKINIVMPLLYESRQHKRRGNESLDCAISLQELEKMGVDNIVTFDAHDPSICNAIPRLPFENFYPTYTILSKFIENEDIHDLLVVSPDMGAMDRARVYADMLNVDVGVFYKRRDLSKVVNGKNPIVEHMYMGADPKGKDIIVVDDMIASGASMIEVAENLKEKGANNIYLIATFSLFTEGTDVFVNAYKKGLFTKVYSTNLSYIPEELVSEDWFIDVDCSKFMANIINTLNKKDDLDELWNVKPKLMEKLQNKKSSKE
ncbi:MAG: ribose-phosphate diphosphokinase [Erysipelotrichales bacterium]|nr:ribose-phosphate diphosphokinase [Erysipelotrichales bacterium]